MKLKRNKNSKKRVFCASEACKLPSVPAKFPTTCRGGKGHGRLLQWRHSAMRIRKQSGDSGLLLIPISNLHPRGFAVSSIFPETSASASSHFQGMVSFLCQGPGSRPTSFTDVRVSGAVGRLSSDQKARQPSILSRILLIDWYIFFSCIYFFLVLKSAYVDTRFI